MHVHRAKSAAITAIFKPKQHKGGVPKGKGSVQPTYLEYYGSRWAVGECAIWYVPDTAQEYDPRMSIQTGEAAAAVQVNTNHTGDLIDEHARLECSVCETQKLE